MEFDFERKKGLVVAESLPGNKEDLMYFFNKFLRPGESLWRCKIPKTELAFFKDKFIMQNIIDYFEKQEYNSDIVETYHGVYRPSLENFIKLLWLTDEFFNNNLKNPIGSYYDPENKINIIHPGGSRQKVLKLFHQGPVDAIYFNTGGQQFDFLHDLNKISIYEFLDFKYAIAITPHHGSLIPHIHIDQTSISPGVIKWQNHVRSLLSDSNFSIKTNRKLKFLKPWLSETGNIELIFNDNHTIKDEIVGLIFLFLGYSITNSTMSLSYKHMKPIKEFNDVRFF